MKSIVIVTARGKEVKKEVKIIKPERERTT
jgi:hypothetical protein